MNPIVISIETGISSMWQNEPEHWANNRHYMRVRWRLDAEYRPMQEYPWLQYGGS